MTLFALKLIVMITMVIDHTGVLLCDNNTIMRFIGRIAFLTYAFLMAEGYYHLKDKPDRLRYHMIKLCTGGCYGAFSCYVLQADLAGL